MFSTIELDGTEYHARAGSWDDEGNVLTWDLVPDENGEPIPADICLCFAHSASECCCGAWYRDHYWED